MNEFILYHFSPCNLPHQLAEGKALFARVTVTARNLIPNIFCEAA